MSRQSIQNKIFNGIVWKFSERVFAQLVSFIISVILARLLTPSEYGLVAIALIFITLADVFISSGFATALIQKKDSSEIDFSTVFYCNLAISLLIFFIIFIIAPLIADFYSDDSLSFIIRIFALKIPLSVFNSIQHAYVSRYSLFKKFFCSTLIGTIISGIAGILLAFKGFGVWALIAQNFTNMIVDSIVLYFTVPWRPNLLFSKRVAVRLMYYSMNILAADLSGTIFVQLRSFVIGKVFAPTDLAFFNKGQQLPNFISINFINSVATVLFPAISDENENLDRVKQIAKKTYQLLSYFMFPVLACLAAVAKPLVIILFTDKWSNCIPFTQLFCISSAVGMFSIISLHIIKAIGKGDVVLKLELLKKPVFILLLIIGVYNGIIAIAICMVIYDFYGAFVNMYQLKKYINYDLLEQLKDLRLSFFMTAVMVLAVILVNPSLDNIIINLFIKLLVGLCVYLVLSSLLKPPAYKCLLKVLLKAEYN